MKTFLERPIEGDWACLWIDATYLKVRRGGRIVSVAVIIAVGVNTHGRREVLGMEVGSPEAEPIRTEFLRQLTRRGRRGAKLAVCDAHEGIKAAVSKVLNATWQRCRVHFMPNVLAHMTFPWEHRTKLHSINPIERINGEIKRRTDVPRVGLCPPEDWLGIFPNDDAIVRLLGAILLEQNDEWAVQRSRYMTLGTIAPLGDDPLISLPAVAR